MPELPEVQTIVDDLISAGVQGTVITSAKVYWPRSIATPQDFTRRIRGQRINRIWRRGKYIIFEFASGMHMLVHLRMSGRLHLCSTGAPHAPHEHVVLKFADRRDLRLHDTRKFGRISLVADAGEILQTLGVEPLDPSFTQRGLATILYQHHRMLKPLLLDQGVIAGIGNIYVDEALWEAGLHPCRRSDTLREAEVLALHAAIRRVLKRGLANRGTSLGKGKTNYASVGRRHGRNAEELRVFRKTGELCPRCGTPVERIVVAQRGTHHCPRCQQFPKQKSPRAMPPGSKRR